MSDIERWLRQLELDQYATVFEQNHIGLELLADLDHETLKEIGVSSAGHRLRMLKAVAGGVEPAAPAARDDTQSSDPPAASPAPAEAQRRQLTVMFCDLVGSTALSTRLDPEDLRELMRAFQDRCAGAVSRFGGFVARYMGDALLVYFGYPRTREDEPERAVRAGLDIVRSIAELDCDVSGAQDVECAVRIGIATGVVVVGDIVGEGAAAERAVVGETPNLAARLQALAGPNQIVVSETTRSLLTGRFEYDDLGQHSLKGIENPVPAWRVVGEREPGRASGGRGAGGLALVGRHEELGLLLRAWETSKDGLGQTVLIRGDPGIGKSRLVEALRERLADGPLAHLWTVVRCSPYHTASAFYPIIKQLEKALRWEVGDGVETRFEKLERGLGGYSFSVAEVAPLLASLLSLPSDSPAPAAPSPQQQRQMTLDAIAGWLLEETERRPVVQVWEDLHWADPSTLELLRLYIEQGPTSALLNVMTFRPDFEPPWQQRSHITPITLNRLERVEVDDMVAGLTKGKRLPGQVAEHITEKSDGVPLYVEHLTKSLLESELLEEHAEDYVLTGALADLQIPATLQDTLMSRLDRVPAAREFAQLAATLGREFDYEHLHALAGAEEATLRSGLDQLVAAELLYQRGRPPRARYVFRHALIRDAAYHSLLKSVRRKVHGDVARLMEQRFAEIAQANPELVAYHFSEAGAPEQAVSYWHRSGSQASGRSASAEAVAHLTKALELLEQLPETSQRDDLELQLQTLLGLALVASQSDSAPGAGVAYARARELCERLGARDRLAPVLRGEWMQETSRGDLRKALGIAEELVQLVQSRDRRDLQVAGAQILAQTYFFLGQPLRARPHADDGIRLYDPASHRFAEWPGADPGEQCHVCAAAVASILGDFQRSTEFAERALELSRARAHPFSLACCSALLCIPTILRRDVAGTQELHRESLQLCTKYRVSTWIEWNRIVGAWVRAESSGPAAVLPEMGRDLDAFRALSKNFLPLLLGLHAEVCAKAGETSAGLESLSEAFAVVEQTEGRMWEPELHRLEGELRLTSDPRAAERCFLLALDVAQQQGARAFALRSATSLAALQQAQGKPLEARETLTPVYYGFDGSFDTADLRRAQALLERLSAGGRTNGG